MFRNNSNIIPGQFTRSHFESRKEKNMILSAIAALQFLRTLETMYEPAPYVPLAGPVGKEVDGVKEVYMV